jgi:hypothetical protein
MGDKHGGESIGLLHSMGIHDGNKVHGNREYNSLRMGDPASEAEPIEKYSFHWFKIQFWQHATKENAIVFSSVFVLIVATAMERVTFKIMVDRMLPYKLTLVQIIFLFSAFTFVGLTKVQCFWNPDIHDGMTEFPQNKIMVMAAIDTVPFILMAVSASGVPPTMTVVLMHASTIFVVLGSKVIFPQRDYSKYNYIGIGLIAGAIGLCLIKVMFWRIDLISSASSEVALCCWTFLVAASLHGVSTLYKEKSIIEYGRPIDNMYLSSCLFFYQCVATFGLAITINLSKGMSRQNTSNFSLPAPYCVLIPRSALLCLSVAIAGYAELDNLFTNIYDGWKCFFGFQSSLDDDSYVDCSESMGVVLGYVVCNAAVVVCMSTVLTLSNQILGRATEAAILFAFVVLWVYDVHINDSSMFGGNEGLGDILAIIVLIAGMEVYDRDPEPDVQVIANQGSLLTSPSSSKDSNPNSETGTPA